ncbi:hypothetical protein BDZ91DRAFT_682066 [Kalaharituber pfeilii]|nr:hypothetical protein BDZ91DRAFT_682066 [Kalaharituber pfeilii]
MDPSHDFLQSSFFKIVLNDPKGTVNNRTDCSPSANLPKKKPEFYVHRDLLASLSPELHKHVINDVKEGLKDVMELSDVDEPTMRAFLLWAYSKDYTTPLPESSSTLLYHTKIYVLAHRFNTLLLKGLAYSKITELLAHVGTVSKEEDIAAILSAITYAFENLPCGTGNTTSSSYIAVPSEKLLKYFAQYCAWSLDGFRDKNAFGETLLACPQFAKAVVMLLPAIKTPPRVEEPHKNGENPKTLQVATASSNHLLFRQCTTCKYKGRMSIKCPGCNYMDDEIGLVVELPGGQRAVLGEDRLKRSFEPFIYKCKWCETSNFVRVDKHFCCRKCHSIGVV